MIMHDRTVDKIRKIFGLGTEFCEEQSEIFKSNPDILFIISAFDKAFDGFSFKLRKKENYTLDDYHEEIYDFDSVMSSWRENLPYNIRFGEEHSNDLYDVLFSTLQAAENIISYDLDDQEAYPIESHDDLESEDTESEITYIEKEF